MLRDPPGSHSAPQAYTQGAPFSKANITICNGPLQVIIHTLMNGFWALSLAFSTAGESLMFLLSEPLPLSGVPLAPAIEHM